MSAENTDSSKFLDVLRAKRAALDTLISAYETAQALGALGQPGDVSSFSGNGISGEAVELPVGAFLGKSIPAAIKLYLSAVKKKQTIKEISKALQDGGVETTASNFETVVTGALNRLKGATEVLRFKDGWGLSEHYNEALRARLAQNQKPNRKTKPKKNKAKSKIKTESKPGLEKTIQEELKGGGKELKELAEKLGKSNSIVALALGRMQKKGLVRINADKWSLPLKLKLQPPVQQAG
jgi:hypothetical protein